MPFVSGELSLFDEETRGVTQQFNTILHAQVDIIRHFACVSAEGLTHLGDHCHFDSPSARRSVCAMLKPCSSSFLEVYDFSGKTIIPFCTHGGGGMGRSVSDIRKNCVQPPMSSKAWRSEVVTSIRRKYGIGMVGDIGHLIRNHRLPGMIATKEHKEHFFIVAGLVEGDVKRS